MREMSAPVSPPDAGPPAAAAAPGSEFDLVDSSDAGPAALRGSVLLGGGYAISIGLSLISVPLLIRHLGIVDFGRYTTVVALASIVGGLTDAGLFNIALREWASRRGEDRARLMRSLLGVRLVLSASGVIVGALFAIAAGYSSTMIVGTLIAGATMVLTAIGSILMVPLQGELRFGWVTVVNLTRQVASVALIVILVLAGAGLLPLLASGLVAGILTTAVAIPLVRGRMPVSPSFGDGQWWPLVRETLPYGASIALNTVYFRITIVVMSIVAESRQTGYFATSFRVTEVLIGVPALAIGAAFPILSRSARSDKDRFASASDRVVELAIIAGIGLALAVSLSAPFVIVVLAGSQGSPAVPVLQFQAIALAATFVSMASAFVLLSLRRHTALLVANGLALLTNVALTLILVLADQARGAAIAAALAECCLALGQMTLLLRARQIRVRWRTLGTIALAAAAGAAPLLLNDVHPILRTILGISLYVGVLALFRQLPPEIGHALTQRRAHVTAAEDHA